MYYKMWFCDTKNALKHKFYTYTSKIWNLIILHTVFNNGLYTEHKKYWKSKVIDLQFDLNQIPIFPA